MIPITQTIFHNDPDGRVGNCLQAAIASITEQRLELVPHFAAIPDGTWFDQTCKFLNDNGFDIFDCEIDEIPHIKDNLVLVTGKSPRGVLHVVIYQNGEMIHDPHPSRDGVLNITWCAVIKSKHHQH